MWEGGGSVHSSDWERYLLRRIITEAEPGVFGVFVREVPLSQGQSLKIACTGTFIIMIIRQNNPYDDKPFM